MLRVTLYELDRNAEQQPRGEFRLENGTIRAVASRSEDQAALDWVLRDFPIKGNPETWLRDLCNQIHGSYFWASVAEES